MMELEKVLKEKFGFEHFRMGQKEIISSVLAGRDTLAMLPTGTGKSLCYQLPGYMLDGHVIIISPLLSLMQDQAEQMMMNGEKRVIALNSFLSRDEKIQAFHHLDRYKFIFISPEMIQYERLLTKLRSLHIALFVIDEAHCISQWGYDFRPDYMKLGQIREQLGIPCTLALTATATKSVKNDIIRSLSISRCAEYIFSADRPNISMKIEHAEGYREKISRLLQLVKELKGPGIIYFSSKRLAEEIAYSLKEEGIKRVMPYHGDLGQENRILIQQQFIHGQLDIICATSAFGMGINKDNVRFIIHFHMPMQLESYIQEIGRAGRDGKESIAILLYAPGDEQLPLQLADGELPADVQINQLKQIYIENENARLNKEEIMQICGLNDIQSRLVFNFIAASLEKSHDYEQVFSDLHVFVEARKSWKRKKIHEVFKWIQTSDCRRKKILNYFGEKTTIEVENCCDVCGIDINGFLKNGHQQTAAEEEKNNEWQDMLYKLLMKKRAGNDEY